MSSDEKLRDDVVEMSKWLDEQLTDLGVTTKLVDLGDQSEGLHLPPVILGHIGDDPTKKTVLVYGHYDVQPVSVRSAHTSVSNWPVGFDVV